MPVPSQPQHNPSRARPSWSDPAWLSIASLAGLIALIVALSALPAGAGEAPPVANVKADSGERASRTFVAQLIVTVGMTVSDIDRSLGFYTSVLGFELESDVEMTGEPYERLHGAFGARARVCTLRLGDERIALTQYLAPEGRPIPTDSRSNDRWFQHIAIIVSDMDAAYARLREHRVRHASTGPQTIPDWNEAAAGIRAFYFKDPDGHVLEILSFPQGKGAEKWHRTGRLFLGIDHTAIVVEDTDASIAFYRDALGMEVAGESENYGPEQERLNNVFGARLRITSMRCAGTVAGPAIELLEYLSPTDGREYPADSHANDLWHWQVTVNVADAPAAERALKYAGAAFVSPGVITIDNEPSGMVMGLMVRDPDGHAIRVIQSLPLTSP